MEYLVYSIEDDPNIAKLISITLGKQGNRVVSFPDGASFFETFERVRPDLILVDLTLPDMSGTEIIKKLRSDRINDDIDIIVVSANHMTTDKVDSLDLGADDYIEKPFDILEMMSRVNVHLRKRRKPEVYKIESLRIDTTHRIATLDGEVVPLTTREIQILVILFEAEGKPVSREEILAKIWDTSINDIDEFETRTIDMHIKAIRKKLKDQNQKIVTTVYGMGYRINK